MNILVDACFGNKILLKFMLVWLSSTMRKELKDNNLKKTKQEFVVKELESQPIVFIISKSSILIYCSTIPNVPL